MLKKLFFAFDKRETKIFKTVCYSQFAQGVFLIIIGSLLPFVRSTYDLSYRVGGLLMSLFSVGQVIGAMIATIVSLKLGLKKTYVLFTAAVFGGLVLVMLGGNPVYLLIVFLIMGTGRSALASFNNNEGNKLPGDVGVNLNVVHMLFAFGALVAPLLVWLFTNVMAENAWKGANVGVIVLGAISILMIVKTPFLKEAGISAKKEKKTFDFGFLREKKYVVCTLMMIMYIGVETGVVGWVATFFLESGVIKEENSALLASLLWAAFFIGRFCTVFLSRKLSGAQIVVILSILAMISMVIMISGKSLAVMLLGAFGTGLGMSGVYASALSEVSDVMNKYTFAMSTFMFITSIGAIAAPYLIGEIAETHDTNTGMWVLAAFSAAQGVFSFIYAAVCKKADREVKV